MNDFMYWTYWFLVGWFIGDVIRFIRTAIDMSYLTPEVVPPDKRHHQDC